MVNQIFWPGSNAPISASINTVKAFNLRQVAQDHNGRRRLRDIDRLALLAVMANTVLLLDAVMRV